MLTQVAGRAGRAHKPGEVLIQTYNPDHYAIQLAKKQDFEAFYRYEMAIRRQMAYPLIILLWGLHFPITQKKMWSKKLTK